MQDPFLDLKVAISNVRFAEYARTASNDAEALARYVWNARLCEALYPALLHVEVALRNNLHNAISARFPTGPWVDVPCWMDLTAPILEADEIKEVNKAKWRLKEKGRPLEVGRMVAELNFGFWNSLLDVRYERSNILWPHLLQDVFPNIPKRDRKRKVVSTRVNKIRHLRNRVFHYEPIWHWMDLMAQHEALVETVGWLSTDLLILTRAVDRFDDVFHETWNRHATGVLG